MIADGQSAAQARILYCHCAHSELLTDPVREAALKAILQSGLPYHAVSDLCELAARHDPMLAELASGGGLTVVACHQRAVRWLFSAGGAPLADGPATFFDMRAEAPQDISERLQQHLGRQRTDCACTDLEALWLRLGDVPQDAWTPWFPVIDRDRCIDCRQCLNFCIFGVYSVSAEGHVQVTSPANCKTNCPACARVCPRVAIMFPKHAAGPISGSLDSSEGEPVAVDIAALTSGDVYETLRRREQGAKRRFSQALQPPPGPADANADAAKAPCACSLTDKLLAKLGVPAEVFQSLGEDERSKIARLSGAAVPAAPPNEQKK